MYSFDVPLKSRDRWKFPLQKYSKRICIYSVGTFALCKIQQPLVRNTSPYIIMCMGLLTQFFSKSRDYDCIILNINEMQFLYGIHTTPANIAHTIKSLATNHRLPVIYKYTRIQLNQFTIVPMPSPAWYQTIFKREFALYRSTIKSSGVSLILMNNF